MTKKNHGNIFDITMNIVVVKMKRRKLLQEYAKLIKEKANDFFFKLCHRKDPQNFTRKRKLGFAEVLLIMLNFKTKSNALETYNFATEINESDPASRQAFEKARDNIKSSAFKEFFEDSVQMAVSADDAKLFHGYRVGAIDGSTALLPKSDELAKKYGSSTPVEGNTYARISLCNDVLNGVVLDGEISDFSIGERKLAMKHIEKDICPNMLYLFDRGYWSPELVAAICDRGQKFLMRLASNAILAISNSKETSGNHTISFNGKKYVLRYYKFELSSGEIEYLLTNLEREEVSDRELVDLYHLRWGIETKYDELKNRLQFEGLSGKSVNIVEQDFYASLIVMNMTGFAIAAADAKVQEKHKEKNNKHACKPNGNMAVGILKNRFIKAIIEDDPLLQANMIDKLINDISRFVIPIKPDRHYPRSKTISKHRRTRRPKNPL